MVFNRPSGSHIYSTNVAFFTCDPKGRLNIATFIYKYLIPNGVKIADLPLFSDGYSDPVMGQIFIATEPEQILRYLTDPLGRISIAQTLRYSTDPLGRISIAQMLRYSTDPLGRISITQMLWYSTDPLGRIFIAQMLCFLYSTQRVG
jgi:hypothetical protein